MEKEIIISERISYLKASDNPLSADVICVRGNSFSWIYDVGASDEAVDFISQIMMPKKIVLSHFHPDHISNIGRIDFDELFVSKNTYRYINRLVSPDKKITVIGNDYMAEDGIDFHIFPLPSSHAKGSLGMEVCNEYAFLGDGTYFGKVNGVPGYNASILYEEIKVLKSLGADKFFLSHSDSIIHDKNEVIDSLTAYKLQS